MEKWYFFCQILGRIIAYLWVGKIEGNMPQKGAAVIVSNHKKYFDPALIGIFLNRRVWFLAKKPVFKWFFIGWLIKKSNWALPVTKKSPESLRAADDLLKNGGAILLFPEGTRNKTSHRLKSFEKGFARLAIKNNVAVVPVAIIYNRLWLLPGGVRIRIGKPIMTSGFNEEQLTDIAWKKIYSLLSQE